MAGIHYGKFERRKGRLEWEPYNHRAQKPQQRYILSRNGLKIGTVSSRAERASSVNHFFKFEPDPWFRDFAGLYHRVYDFCIVRDLTKGWPNEINEFTIKLGETGIGYDREKRHLTSADLDAFADYIKGNHPPVYVRVDDIYQPAS